MIIAAVFIVALLFANMLLVIDRHRVIYHARVKHINSLYNVKSAYSTGVETGKRVLNEELKKA